jgi:hypothetical protein
MSYFYFIDRHSSVNNNLKLNLRDYEFKIKIIKLLET